MGNFNNYAYDPTEVYANFEQSVSDDNDNNKSEPTYIPDLASKASLLAIPLENDFDSLCTPYIANKQTCIISQNKLMTKVNEKLNKVYVNL